MPVVLAIFVYLCSASATPPRVIIIQDAPGHACFKRMAIGRSLMDRFVKRALLCDSLRACEEACQNERAFECEGFNFKFDRNGEDNKCQLTDIKSNKLDLTRDFNADVDFDFYDRDLNGPRHCFFRPGMTGGLPGGGGEYGPGPYGRPGGPGYGGPGGGGVYGGGRPGPGYGGPPGGGGRPGDPGYGGHPGGQPGGPGYGRPPGGDGHQGGPGYGGHHGGPGYGRPPGGDGYPGGPGYGGQAGGYGGQPGGGGYAGPPGGGGYGSPPGGPPHGPPGIPQGGYGGGYPGGGGGYDQGGRGPPAYPGGHQPPRPGGDYGGGYRPGEDFGRPGLGGRPGQDRPGGGVPSDNALGPPLYPPDNRHEYGGGAYGLGSGGGLPDECFLRSRTGFRLDRRVVLVSLTVPSLYECETMCVNERKFKCNIFSFRYSVSPSVPSHNCHLGEKPYTELDSYQDVIPDRDYDIYERNPTGKQGCQPKKQWGSDCFERVRSGLKLKPNMVKFGLKCSSLKECESACLNMPYFTCRAFSYRYGPPVIGESEENCLLTDWPIPEMNAQKHLSEDPECELYHRGSYGHGCEINRYPSRGQLPQGPGVGGPGGRPLQPPPTDDGYGPGNEIPSTYLPPDKRPFYPHDKPQGYLPPPRPSPGYLPPEKPQGYLPPPPPRPSFPPDQAYPPQKYYPPKQDGYLPPPKDGYLPPHKPDGYLPPHKPEGYLPPRKPDGYLPPRKDDPYSYKPSGYPPPHPQQGYLPPQKPQYGEHPSSHGGGSYGPGYGYGDHGGHGHRPGETYLPPGKYGVSGGRPWPTDQLCYIRYSTPARLLPQAVKNALWVPGEVQCKEECTRAREKTKFRCATLSYREGQCELSDIEQRDLRPGYDYLHDNNDFWMFTWDFGAPGCYKPPPPGKPPLLSEPHYLGDRGVEDTWSRFTVNGQPCRAGTVCSQNKEIGVWTCPVASGDWDYCCRSGHQCGFSEGFDYPWCYVGSSDKDQWRPCSETYSPYAHSGRRAHWPVAYLHREGPPNVTLSHKPSIVESFLKSLEKSGFKTTQTSSENSITSPEPRTEEEDSAMDKLLKWGKTALKNLTSTSTTAQTLSTSSTVETTLGNITSATDMTGTVKPTEVEATVTSSS